ncbi:fumarylacetoacetate hydrolase domain-containing protein 2A [Columba livia]|nr:fumarylacetoacetate hydrolase domain-containing protein 2A [Columba livia]
MRLAGAMRLVRFRGPGGAEPRLGLEEAPGGALVDLSAAEPALPGSMRSLLESGPSALAAAHRSRWPWTHVVGFTVANDVSARDWQMRNGRQWLLGKTFDTFCPLGPALVTKEAVTDVHNLRIRCSVNGQVMQDSSTSQLIFPLPKLIAWVSRFVTLVPGDILLTGTPAGVGFFRKPPCVS